jgi:hypothetical protein
MSATKSNLLSVIDGKTGRPVKRIADARCRAKLNTAVDIRKEMSKLYRETRSGLLDIQDSTKLVWILASIAKVIESAEMETRLKALEEDL